MSQSINVKSTQEWTETMCQFSCRFCYFIPGRILCCHHRGAQKVDKRMSQKEYSHSNGSNNNGNPTNFEQWPFVGLFIIAGQKFPTMQTGGLAKLLKTARRCSHYEKLSRSIAYFLRSFNIPVNKMAITKLWSANKRKKTQGETILMAFKSLFEEGSLIQK